MDMPDVFPSDTVKCTHPSDIFLFAGIILTGFLANEDLEEAYRGSAAYVFPSLFEGFGLSLIEAMHFGTPCACSETSSLGEIGRGAALLFDPEDPAAIADAMRRLLTDSALREELKEAGRVRSAEFTWTKHVERIIHAVESSRS